MAPGLTQTADAMSTVTITKPSLPSVQDSDRAYVTFLAGNGDYVKGVVGLAKGLRKVKSAYPLVVAMLPDVPEEHRRILVDQGCIVREIEPVYPPENQTQFAMAYYVINYSKLRIWKVRLIRHRLTPLLLCLAIRRRLAPFEKVVNALSFFCVFVQFVEYSKMIYLDGDIQVYENIDHLFDLPDGYLYAVMDCFCEKTWSHTPQYKIRYCQQCPDKVQWPKAELGEPPALYFNAGMFLYEPNLETYEDLLRTLKITPPTPFAEQVKGKIKTQTGLFLLCSVFICFKLCILISQDFLNMYFKKIYKPIPLVYNLVLAMLWRHPENVELGKVKVVHYCAAVSYFVHGLVYPKQLSQS